MSDLRVLVLEPNEVVAEDVATTVVEVLGACTIDVVSSEADALDLLGPDGGFGLVIVGVPLPRIASGPLGAALGLGGLAVVVIGDVPSDPVLLSARPGWVFVPRPFSTPILRKGIADATGPIGGAGNQSDSPSFPQ